MRIPAFEWLRGYQPSWLRADIVAGLTAGAIVIPKAMAYATIADIPLQAGLYTAFLPMIVYAVLGTSAVLSVSTTTTIAILGGAAIGGSSADAITATATLAVLVGAILLAARLFKLGFLANFISDPVLTGFKAGIGLVIVVDQFPKLVGIKIHKENFFLDAWHIVEKLPDTKTTTLAVALATFAVIIVFEKFFKRAPAPLIAIGLGTAASAYMGLQAMGVSVVGEIPGGFPKLTLPDAQLALEMWPAAAGIALMSFTETITSARAFAPPGSARPDANQELVAIGAGNVVGGLFGSMPTGGGTSQTNVNMQSGAKTQAAELVTAAMTLATMLFLAPVLAPMPNAVLAAVVIAYSIGLIDPAEMKAIRAIRTLEFRWAIAAMVGVLLLGTLKGILVAVLLSLAGLLARANNPRVDVLGRKPGTNVFRPRSPENPGDEDFPGLVIVKTEGRMYFANAPVVGERMREIVDREKPKVVAFDCGAIPGVEFTALKMLIDAEAQLRSEGVELWLVALNPEALEMVQRTPLAKTLGHERMFFNLESAVDSWQARRAN
jgi:high affinity sulfate transporter 1